MDSSSSQRFHVPELDIIKKYIGETELQDIHHLIAAKDEGASGVKAGRKKHRVSLRKSLIPDRDKDKEKDKEKEPSPSSDNAPPLTSDASKKEKEENGNAVVTADVLAQSELNELQRLMELVKTQFEGKPPPPPLLSLASLVLTSDDRVEDSTRLTSDRDRETSHFIFSNSEGSSQTSLSSLYLQRAPWCDRGTQKTSLSNGRPCCLFARFEVPF